MVCSFKVSKLMETFLIFCEVYNVHAVISNVIGLPLLNNVIIYSVSACTFLHRSYFISAALYKKKVIYKAYYIGQNRKKG